MRRWNKGETAATYDSEFVESFKELRREVDVLRRDVGVDEVDELRRLRHDVERLEVVRLFSQVVLPPDPNIGKHTHTFIFSSVQY